MTDVVIDVGCADWGSETSVLKLIDRFQPRVLLGFDPAPAMQAQKRRGYTVKGTRVEIVKAAAWTEDGIEHLAGKGTRARIEPGGLGTQVETVDLARVIRDIGEPVVLKLDCEGAEYPLLAYLIATNVIRQVELVLVEWHDDGWGERPMLEATLRLMNIPVEEWE